MPHSFSLPFTAFLQTNTNPKTGATYTTFLPPSELQNALVKAIGEDNAKSVLAGERSIITSCGSGMTAGVLWLGLRILGAQKVSLYDEVRGYSMNGSTCL
jgi:thiosulfate/3-mercaptopyruvate sulfurtransferase